MPPSSIPVLQNLLNCQPASSNPSGNEDGTADFDTAITVVISLLTFLKVKTPILVILQLEHGMNLFEKTRASDQATFWQVTCEISQLVQKEKLTALLNSVVVRRTRRMQPTFNSLKGLNGVKAKDVVFVDLEFLPFS